MWMWRFFFVERRYDLNSPLKVDDMKIASWNINSIRARLPNLEKWLNDNPVDFLFLQEIKSQEENFPYDDIKKMGYNAIINGQKSYNGVAILTKHNENDLSNIETTLYGDDSDEQARFISLDYKGTKLINIYLPNGNGGDEKYEYKLKWMERLVSLAKKLRRNEQDFLIAGDYNVIPTAQDCYSEAAWMDDALYKLTTRQAYRELLNLGLYDAFRINNHEPHQYTFWDYQAGRWQKDEGIRIDHFLLSPNLTDRLKTCEIDRSARGEEKASDHTPIVIELEELSNGTK